MKTAIALLGLIGSLSLPSPGTATPQFEYQRLQAQTTPTAPSQLATPLCPQQVVAELDALRQRPELARSQWGILVQTLAAEPRDRQTLYAHAAQSYLLPASTNKLLTTAAVLRQLGPDFRIATSVYGLPGQAHIPVLRVVGQGDPSLTTAQLDGLAQQLRRQGLQRVDQLVGDDTYFVGAAVHPNWDWEDVQAGYGAPVNSLILDENALGLTLIPQALGQPLRVEWDEPLAGRRWQVDNQSLTVAPTADEFVAVGQDFDRPVLRVQGQLRVGAAPEPVAIAVSRPAERFLQTFQRRLNQNQVVVAQWRLKATPQQPGETRLATVQSPPLAQLVYEVNQNSNNLYAEALLKTLGMRQTTARSQDATARGIQAVKATLTSMGVDPNGYELVDGSGLARRNLVSPEAIVQTLQGMAQVPEAAIYRASLPVAGQSGTLKQRFQGTVAQGIVVAKTGTLTGVSALAGYLSPPAYPPLVFSMIVNNSTAASTTLRQTIDQMVLVLARLRTCGQ